LLGSLRVALLSHRDGNEIFRIPEVVEMMSQLSA
jgi:hypothetical protein